jgi:cob(I)alamin adenosyltransferase
MKQGYVQLYTGSGKGKTTAALGLALRASGAGLHCYILQFMKKGEFSEIAALRHCGNQITVEQCGSESFYNPSTSSFIEHRGLAKSGYLCACSAITSGEYELVILDEIIDALNFNLITYEEVIALLDMRSSQVELVLTGRDAPTDLFERCDLVTEMKEHRHYYTRNVAARKGIEY